MVLDLLVPKTLILFQRDNPFGGKCLIQVGLAWVFGHKFPLKILMMEPNGSTTRDDQESLLNVVISNVDYRKNDTTRYSAGDTGLGMDGYHYWSYQGATNADNDGLGINYGTSAIECATSNDSGCFWADGGTDIPRAAMITSSDPYKSGDMTLSVNYNSNTDTFSTGSFNAAIIQQINMATVIRRVAINSTYRGVSTTFKYSTPIFISQVLQVTVDFLAVF